MATVGDRFSFFRDLVLFGIIVMNDITAVKSSSGNKSYNCESHFGRSLYGDGGGTLNEALTSFEERKEER